MIPYLEKLFGNIPAYFSQFFQLLVSPRKFITNLTNADEKVSLEKSIVFLFISFVITLLLTVLAGDNPLEIQALQKKDEGMLTALTAKAFFYLICIGFCVLIVKWAYKLVGGKASFAHTFSATTSALAMFMVFSSIVDLLLVGVINLDPQVAKMQVLMEKESNAQQSTMMDMLDSLSSSNATIDSLDLASNKEWVKTGQRAIEKIGERPVAKMALVLGAIAYIPILLWMLFAWLGMQELQQVSLGKNLVALFIAVIGLFVFTSLWNLVETGVMLRKEMKQRYQQDSTQNLKDMLSDNSTPALINHRPDWALLV